MVSCIGCNLSHSSRRTGITFHRFPKKQELRAAWIRFVNRTEESIPKFAVLCSQHFMESDFDSSAFRKILNRNAAPSIHVQRNRYEKISKIQFETVFVEVPSTSRQTEKQEVSIEPISKSVDNYNESQGSLKRSKRTAGASTSVGTNTAREMKLQEQVTKISDVCRRQSRQIRHLQKKVWFQKKRIFRLSSVITELKKKNLINSDQAR